MWVMSTVEETEAEVMNVVETRTLVQFKRDVLPENMYDPLTKEEVSGMHLAVEREWESELRPAARKEVTMSVCGSCLDL